MRDGAHIRYRADENFAGVEIAGAEGLRAVAIVESDNAARRVRVQNVAAVYPWRERFALDHVVLQEERESCRVHARSKLGQDRKEGRLICSNIDDPHRAAAGA